MTPEEAKKVNDLRMTALTAMREGRDIREVLTKEELSEALRIIRESRRSAADNSSFRATGTKKPKAAKAPTDTTNVPDELKDLFTI